MSGLKIATMTSAMPWWAALVSGILLTCCLSLAIPGVLRRLPEPHPDTPGAHTKPPYEDLASLRFVLSTAVLGGLGFALAAGTQPVSQLAPWLVLSCGGLLAVAIDAVTTWIPRHLTYLCWAALTVSFPVVGALDSWGVAVRMALGALAAAALFWLIWRITSAGIGFGDVRLMPALGAAAGAAGWDVWLAMLVIGTGVGAGWGILLRLRGRYGGFAYGPALMVGPFAGIALQGLL